MWVNLGCGPFRAREPWVNLDVVEDEHTRPDSVVDIDDPLREFKDIDRLYCGHLIEHVPWDGVPGFLNYIYDHVADGGEVVFVAPDVHRTIKRYALELDPEGWSLVESVLEGPWGDPTPRGYYEPRQEFTRPGGRHQWNCWEYRLVHALDQSNFPHVEAMAIDPEGPLGRWPVVAFTQWQCAARAVK